MKEKIIRLKECFKFSKTEDHYQQFDSLCRSSFLSPLFFNLLFYYYARAYSLYLGYHSLLWLGMPPSHWVSWALLPFRLSHGFFSFFLEIFTCPSVWGVILVEFFFMKEKLFKLKKGLQGIYFSECERNNKDSLSSFQTQAVKINKLWSRPMWWFGLCKRCISWVYEQWVHYIPLFKHLKQHVSRVIMWGWQFIFYSCILA
jgi:hypothetical protein